MWDLGSESFARCLLSYLPSTGKYFLVFSFLKGRPQTDRQTVGERTDGRTDGRTDNQSVALVNQKINLG